MIRVVIAEDDPMVTHINSQYIGQFPDMVVEASFANGRDAWEYIEKNPPDLVILDVYMPRLSGMEILQNIRAKSIPTEVIMVTAANEIASVDRAMKLGIVDYLIKPFEYGRFCRAVTKYMQRKNLLQAGQTVSQEAVDSLLQNMAATEQDSGALRKGLNAKTVQYIAAHLEENAQEQHTCESLSKTLGLSKVTIRRYLNYFIEIGSVVSTIDYETGGRPSMRYMYKAPIQ